MYTSEYFDQISQVHLNARMRAAFLINGRSKTEVIEIEKEPISGLRNYLGVTTIFKSHRSAEETTRLAVNFGALTDKILNDILAGRSDLRGLPISGVKRHA